jgi:hypothetical protein
LPFASQQLGRKRWRRSLGSTLELALSLAPKDWTQTGVLNCVKVALFCNPVSADTICIHMFGLKTSENCSWEFEKTVKIIGLKNAVSCSNRCITIWNRNSKRLQRTTKNCHSRKKA